MGKVVVGSNVGGIRELITHDKDGFLFKAGDVNELSSLLVELIDDKKALSRISTAAVKTIQKKHRWDMIIQRYLPVYKRLIHV